jgi:uncharacterized protein YfiM (DUF2279 family)
LAHSPLKFPNNQGFFIVKKSYAGGAMGYAGVLKIFTPRVLAAAVILLFVPGTVSGFETDFSKEETLLISNGIGLAAITTWGVLNWDYFKNDPKTADEGWFSDNTKSGGQDKIGHFYFAYSLSHILSAIYEKSGYSSRQGAFLGSISSFGLTTWMELGDSFSRYGFSYEDVVMNLMGSAAGYWLYTCPAVAQKIDFRMEYRPDFDELDFFTDYERQKFLVALKFDGFDFAQKNYLKYLELHLGYFTRGYEADTRRERNLYIGIGLNLSRLFKGLSMPGTARAFNYIQLPYSYIGMDRDLKD